MHRNMAFEWSLPDASGMKKTVCRGFFLSTTGFQPSNASVVRRAVMTTGPCASPDMRGRHEPHNKLDATTIIEHINSYHP